MLSFNASGFTNGSPISTSTNASAGLASAGGSSAIIIDNAAGVAGASQIYFSTLSNQSCTGGSGGCAVQASQSG